MAVGSLIFKIARMWAEVNLDVWMPVECRNVAAGLACKSISLCVASEIKPMSTTTPSPATKPATSTSISADFCPLATDALSRPTVLDVLTCPMPFPSDVIASANRSVNKCKIEKQTHRAKIDAARRAQPAPRRCTWGGPSAYFLSSFLFRCRCLW